jgi:hypothetical protein
MSKVRIYRIRETNAPSAPARLIRAANVASARNYVARDTLDVSIPTPDEAHQMACEGIGIEDVGSEPADAEPAAAAPQLKVA